MPADMMDMLPLVLVWRSLMSIKDQLHGTVKLIFQPAEEGVRGAKSIVDNGHLDGVDYLIGSHVTNKKEDDPAVVIPGSYGSLATTKYDVIFHGKSAMRADHRRLGGMSCCSRDGDLKPLCDSASLRRRVQSKCGNCCCRKRTECYRGRGEDGDRGSR